MIASSFKKTSYLQRRTRILIRLVSERDLLGMSASIAYYTVLSLTPFLLLFLTFVTWIGLYDLPRIRAGITQILGSSASLILESLQFRLMSDSGGLAFGLLGLFTLLFSASGVISQLQSSLDLIFERNPLTLQSNPSQKSPSVLKMWMTTKLYAILALLFCIFAASVSLVFSVIIELLVPVDVQSLWNGVNRLASFSTFALIFTMMFRYLPRGQKPSWRSSFLGGLLCSVLFHLGKGALALFFATGGIESSYGALSSFVVFLLWAYYNALIILISAILERAYFDEETDL